MTPVRLALTICTLSLSAAAVPPVAPAQEGAAGYIEAMRGPVQFRKTTADKPVTLDPAREIARRLYAGDQLRCQAGAALRLRLGGTASDMKCPSDWITIRRAASAAAKLAQVALDEYGRTGGRSRGDTAGVEVFSPSDHGFEIPERLTIRWTQGSARGAVSITVRDAGGGPDLWSLNGIDSAAGSFESGFESGGLRVALLKYRSGPNGVLRLRIVDAARTETTLTFQLLSEAATKTLDLDLARWDKEPGPFMSHLGRGSVFSAALVFSAAAAEYEAALASAPESRDLLNKAIDAHKLSGNYRRVRELTARLPPG